MDYDLIIVGCGPAGMSAGIYSARLGLKTAIFEAKVPGGSMALAHIVENYPGYVRTSGEELTEKMLEQARSCGVELISESVVSIARQGANFEVITDKNVKHTARGIIIATGGEYKKIGIEGEEMFFHKGVSYCPTCDAPLFKEKNVAIIGGGDTAVSGALYLSALCKNVYLIHRRDELRAASAEVEQLKAKPNVQLFLNYAPIEIKGEKLVKSIRIQSVPTEDVKELVVDGVFVCVGEVPVVSLAKSLGVNVNEKEAIIVNEKLETNIPNVWAAGDVTGRYRQIITAAADGTVAAINAFQKLQAKGAPPMIK